MIKTLLHPLYSCIFIIFLLLISPSVNAQVNIDTLAIQDFETTPATPTWAFVGPVVYNSGFSSGSAAPPNSPIGIGGSRAWETTTKSSGLVLDFANILVPAGYDSVRFKFRLAAMNLNSSSGGPDHLDYVLVEYSTDGGLGYFSRMRIRGAANNNSFWPYSASGKAKLYYTPTTEVMFQPVTTGIQNALGYSNCEIVFPGNVSQVRVRMTGRSSSSSDTWLIDNVLLTGEKYCSNTTATITEMACDSFMAPSGQVFDTSGVFTDVINNSTGCDSVITINLTIENIDTSVTVLGPSLISNELGAVYRWLDCNKNYSPITAEVNQTFNVIQNGSYAVEVKKNGCVDTSACQEILGIGISEFSSQHFRVYPNPFYQKIQLKLNNSNSTVDASLYNLQGKLLDKWSFDNGNSDLSIEVNQGPGVYLLKVKSGEWEEMLRLVKLE